MFSFVETREQVDIATLPTYLLGTLAYVPVVMKDALEIQYNYCKNHDNVEKKVNRLGRERSI